VIRDTGLHGGGDPQCPVCPTEIVPREMQCHSGFEIVQLLADGVGQPSQSAKLHTHCQVPPFDVAGRDVLGIRVILTYLGYNLGDWAWGSTVIPELAVVPEQLRELRVVDISPKLSSTAACTFKAATS